MYWGRCQHGSFLKLKLCRIIALMNELEMIGIFPEREGFRREKVGGFIFVKPLEMKQMRDHVVDILMQICLYTLRCIH